jgi:hypothetical protein
MQNSLPHSQTEFKGPDKSVKMTEKKRTFCQFLVFCPYICT